MYWHDSRVLAAMLAGILATAAQASDIGHEIAAQVDVASYQHFLDDLLYTHYGDDRSTDGPEHDLARDNIAATFESYGFEVELQPFYYYYAPDYLGENVVATKTGAIWPDRQYIVGAHYDSYFNPGADDDASGVAGLLELARVYSQYDTGCTIKLIAFDLEEGGLVGSEAYVREFWFDDIRGMIQLDMIAWDDGTYSALIEREGGQSNVLAADLDAAVDEYGTGLLASIGTSPGTSDHASFAGIGVPACMLSEWQGIYNPCCHQPCDSVDEPNYISYDYAADIVRSVAGYLADVTPAYHADDCNQDGISDAQQIQDDPTLDCNGNSFLDECEPGGSEDCNANGMPDLCDIHAGASDDLDKNAVPDDCQPHRYVPAQYATIQAAVDAADVGDVIVVADGTYTGAGNIDVDFLGKDLVLRSENGPENCIIDCAGVGRGFHLGTGETSAAVICGFAITNGYSSAGGGAIRCSDSSPTIANCVLENNDAYRGGAIYCAGGHPTIRQCVIARNTAGAGGGVYTYGSRLTIEACTIVENSAGGGVDCCYGSLTAIGCTIQDNVATVDGGGIECENVSGARLENCKVTGNSAGWHGGGLYCSPFLATAIVSGCEISDNLAGYDGGGIYCNANPGSMALSNCAIVSNTADCGGGICGWADMFTIRNCTVSRNRAADSGGGLQWTGWDDPTITHSIFWHDHPDEIDATNSVPTITYSAIQGGWEGVGNIADDPMITADGKHLLAGSPCIDAGDPNGAYAGTFDIDGEPRDGDTRVDIGPDEFYDLDADGLSDCWEQRYFGSPTVATPNADGESDGWSNIDEYELGSDPTQPPTTYYVAVDGDDSWDGLAAEWDGEHGPKASIRAGVALTDWIEPDVVIVLPGVHTVSELYNMVSFGGKPTTLRSIDPLDPAVVAATVIDRQAQDSGGRIFNFARGERPETIVAGLTLCNARAAFGGAVRCRFGSGPTFSRCIFKDNTSTDSGAAVHCGEQSKPHFQDCVFANNSATSFGGAVYSEDSGPSFANCLFVGNGVDEGGEGSALCLVASEVPLVNCTVTGNPSTQGTVLARALELTPAHVTAAGCILWDGDNTIAHDPNSVVTIAHSTIYGGWPGEGNLDADPLFVDADGPDDDPDTWEDNDYRLSTDSPCIDAGDNIAVPVDLADVDGDAYRNERAPFDLDGSRRFVEDPFTPNTGIADLPIYRFIADMGAYEFQFCLGDLDQNGAVDSGDVAALLEHYGTQTGATYYEGDLDGDCNVDLADLAELLSQYGTVCQ